MTPDQEQMMTVFKSSLDFTDNELELNQQGRLSDHQTELNRRSWWSEMGSTAIFAFTGIALVVIGWLVSSFSIAGVLCLIIPGVLFVALSVLTLVLQLRERRHLSENVVKTVEGIVERGVERRLDSTNNTYSHTYYFKVANTRADVPYNAYAALIPDQPYRLYFARRGSNRLMSIEPLPPRPLPPRSFDLSEE
ncbi:MAG TPA: hypothetical protein VH540_27035 [Ktedonobacterales bacterium]|jgi:hypothetical protein